MLPGTMRGGGAASWALMFGAVVGLVLSGVVLLGPAHAPSTPAAAAGPQGPPAESALQVEMKSVYTVTATETGLPTRIPWTICIWDPVSCLVPCKECPASSRSLASTTSSSLNFSLSNGTYQYAVVANASYATAGGSFTVNGTASILNITFSPVTEYPVVFEESGLPGGLAWNVYLSPWCLADCNPTTSQFTLTLPNGTYSYSPVSQNSDYLAGNGTLTVAGAGVSVPITFDLTYPISFSATGLPTGSAWDVSFALIRPWPLPDHCIESDGGGHLYPGLHCPGANGTLGLNLTNGTYLYAATAQNPSFSAPNGTLTVDGAPVSIGLSFSSVPTYAVTFTAKDLPGGSTFNMSAGPAGTPLPENQSSDGSSSITFYEPAGALQYSFSYPTTPGYYAPYAAVKVTGGPKGTTTEQTMVPTKALKLSVVWDPAAVVSYVETGYNLKPFCPPFQWDVEMSWIPGLNGPINGLLTQDYRNATSTNASLGTISIYMYGGPPLPGHWTVIISHPVCWTVSPSHFTVTIDKPVVEKSIKFKLDTSKVTIKEVGLAKGTPWGGVLGVGPHDGLPAVDYYFNTTKASYVLDLVNGTYNYTFDPVSGYTAPTAGSVAVSAPHAEKVTGTYVKT